MSEHYNVVDPYHYWTVEAINVDLDTKRHPFATLCVNLNNDFNIATVIRNSNAFLTKEVFFYGKKKWDRRGAVGTHHYSHIHHLPEGSDLSALDHYTWVGVDNVPGSVPVEDFDWPDNTLMCFGQEKDGLPPEIIQRCQKVVYISQYGSVRSLNVGCASSIAMYDYTSKYHRKHK